MRKTIENSIGDNPFKTGCLIFILSTIFLIKVTPYLVNFPILFFLFPSIFFILFFKTASSHPYHSYSLLMVFLYVSLLVGITVMIENPPSENPFIGLEKYINLGYWEYNDYGSGYSDYFFYNPNVEFLYEYFPGLLFLVHCLIFSFYMKFESLTVK